MLANESGDHLLLVQVPPIDSVVMHLVIWLVSLLPLTLDLVTPIRIKGKWLIVIVRSPPFRSGECLLDDLCMEVSLEDPPGTAAVRRHRGTSDFYCSGILIYPTRP